MDQRGEPDPATPPAGSWLGRRLELLVGPVAHGGHCVARFEGRVVFVRHALPGESVLAEVTEDRGGSFCRADAVEVREPSPDRVAPRCRYAHPGGCGGCDFQHVSLAAQRELKAAVVAEQLSRLAGLDRAVSVRALDDGDGLGWRRRVRFAVGPAGEIGLRAHRSHQVVPISMCPIGASGVGDAAVLRQDWPGLAELEVAVDDRGEVAELAHRPRPVRSGSGRGRDDRRRGARRPVRPARPVLDTEQLSGPAELGFTVAGHDFVVRPSGFWQTHPRAAEVFTETVLRAADPRPGDRALDLYAGSGLFTAALAAAVTGSGTVLGLEADPGAVADAGANLADLPAARVRRVPVEARSVAAAAEELGGTVDIVVLDPPRSGAGREVIAAVLACAPRVVVYVACDPAALARDVRFARDGGWQLAELEAFDAFPMTYHVECVAVLRPGDGTAGAMESGASEPRDAGPETGTVQVG